MAWVVSLLKIPIIDRLPRAPHTCFVALGYPLKALAHVIWRVPDKCFCGVSARTARINVPLYDVSDKSRST